MHYVYQNEFQRRRKKATKTINEEYESKQYKIHREREEEKKQKT